MADRMLGQMESRAEMKAGRAVVFVFVMVLSSFSVRLAALLLLMASPPDD